jgi:hypothetical protein
MKKLTFIIKIILLFFLFIFLNQSIQAKGDKKPRNYSLNGHLETLETVWIKDFKKNG